MQKKIVISAINIFQGGALSVLEDCLNILISDYSDLYEIIVFVHDKRILNSDKLTLIELPKSRKNYLFRLYYEYFWFYFRSKKIKPYLWFSFHDITPNVKADIRAVYCHNPSPFYKLRWKEFMMEPKLGFFNAFYKYLYRINTTKNDFIVVQQDWIRKEFRKKFNTVSKIIVANPEIAISDFEATASAQDNTRRFFYPTFPRVFKNIECVCEAAKIVNKTNADFELCITISGHENPYSKEIVQRYGSVKNIKFIGSLKRNQVFDIMATSEALVFPSKLETWGLPLSEAKKFNKIILASDLPYAHETVGEYSKVSFFNPDHAIQLAGLMEGVLDNNIQFDGNSAIEIDSPYARNWNAIFKFLLKANDNA
ncbi:MAG TPA: glycosyltransferase [Bacteroidales bacterium]|nr:glycosyltransferase [Bacteroidales bacterium]